MVSWSLRARADLKAIHDYIAKDSPTHAKTVVRELDERHPGYGLGKHKGYGTQAHRSALKRLGLSDIHRITFHAK